MPGQQGRAARSTEDERGTPEVIVLWRMLMRELKRKASVEKKPFDLADDIAQETIARYLQACLREHIEQPDHWCRRVALREWVHVQTAARGYVSIDALAEDHPSEARRAKWLRDAEEGPRLPSAVSNELQEDLSTHRDSTVVTEERELIQMIDPDWREHLEDGVSREYGSRLPWKTRRRIRKRARRVLGEDYADIARSLGCDPVDGMAGR